MMGRNLATSERQVSFDFQKVKTAIGIATRVKDYHQVKVDDIFNSWEFQQHSGLGVAKIKVSISQVSEGQTKISIEAMNLTGSKMFAISDGNLATMVSGFEKNLGLALTGKLI